MQAVSCELRAASCVSASVAKYILRRRQVEGCAFCARSFGCRRRDRSVGRAHLHGHSPQRAAALRLVSFAKGCSISGRGARPPADPAIAWRATYRPRAVQRRTRANKRTQTDARKQRSINQTVSRNGRSVESFGRSNERASERAAPAQATQLASFRQVSERPATKV